MNKLVILIMAASLGLVACSKHKHGSDKGAAHDHDRDRARDRDRDHDHDRARDRDNDNDRMAAEMAAKGSHTAGAALVSVPAEGKKFEPPIQPSQIPEGAWYCDMGTVEYARAEKGDGRCPICKMRLKQKVPEK